MGKEHHRLSPKKKKKNTKQDAELHSKLTEN